MKNTEALDLVRLEAEESALLIGPDDVSLTLNTDYYYYRLCSFLGHVKMSNGSRRRMAGCMKLD